MKPDISRNTTATTLIIVNLIPLAGILFFGWEPVSIFVIYIIESIIIGLMNIVKMFTVYFSNRHVALRKEAGQTGVAGLGIIPFFAAHYFFFIFIQCVLFFAFTGIGSNRFPEPMQVFQNLKPFLLGDTGLAVGGLFLSHSISYALDFMLSGEFTRVSLAQLMFRPYKRIFVQQFVVLAGGFAFMILGLFLPKAALIAFIVVFTVVKIFFDLKFQQLVDKKRGSILFD